MPYRRFASPTPQISEAPKLPTAFAHSHARRHRGLVLFVLHSNETTRTIRKKSTARSATYRPENIVAYQAGNAAKVAPPAVTSHTSLPSQTGPIDANMASRSSSSRGRNGSSMPTPKSNPSSRK